MQRLSDVTSNVNLTLHRRLVPAGFILSQICDLFSLVDTIVEAIASFK